MHDDMFAMLVTVDGVPRACQAPDGFCETGCGLCTLVGGDMHVVSLRSTGWVRRVGRGRQPVTDTLAPRPQATWPCGTPM